MPRIFKPKVKETLKENLLSKGKNLFGERGISGVTVDEITQAVGLGKGTFYNFFDSKEALFFEVFFLAQDELWERFKVHAEDHWILPEPSWKKVKHLLAWTHEALKKDPILKWVTDPKENRIFTRILTPEIQARFKKKDIFWAQEMISFLSSKQVTVSCSPEFLAKILKSLHILSVSSPEPEVLDLFYESISQKLLEI